jgi:hypothetical protein
MTAPAVRRYANLPPAQKSTLIRFLAFAAKTSLNNWEKCYYTWRLLSQLPPDDTGRRLIPKQLTVQKPELQRSFHKPSQLKPLPKSRKFWQRRNY